MIESIREFFKTYDPKSMDKRKKFAIFLPIVIYENQEYVIFEQRSKTVNQPGDICLPGGRVEKGETYEMAAVRECCEEIGTDLGSIEVFGPSDKIVTLMGNPIYPYIGTIKNFSMENIKLSGEVDKIHLVKLSDILNAKVSEYKCILKQQRPEDFPYDLIENGKDYKFSRPTYYHYFYRFNEDLIIWGLTAKILRNFIANIESIKNNFNKS